MVDYTARSFLLYRNLLLQYIYSDKNRLTATRSRGFVRNFNNNGGNINFYKFNLICISFITERVLGEYSNSISDITCNVNYIPKYEVFRSSKFGCGMWSLSHWP